MTVIGLARGHHSTGSFCTEGRLKAKMAEFSIRHIWACPIRHRKSPMGISLFAKFGHPLFNGSQTLQSPQRRMGWDRRVSRTISWCPQSEREAPTNPREAASESAKSARTEVEGMISTRFGSAMRDCGWEGLFSPGIVRRSRNHFSDMPTTRSCALPDPRTFIVFIDCRRADDAAHVSSPRYRPEGSDCPAPTAGTRET
jgi:hypothetical protein